MLVDDWQFVGSLNIADPYTGSRYGDSSFRDLNILVKNAEDAKTGREFYKHLMLRN
jgi:hypothetical protein